MNHLTDEQKARLALRVTERCIDLADGDVDSALSAAAQIADTSSKEELSRLYRREFGPAPRPRTEDDVGMTPRWMQKRERREMKKTLHTLDRALARTAPQRRAIALALDDEDWITLYGIGTVGPA